MKQTLSIKLFLLFSIALLLSGVTLVFYSFYKSSQANIESLIKSNIQTNTLYIKHYLDTNLRDNSINELTSHLDTITQSNQLIETLYIFDTKQEPIYSSSRSALNEKRRNCLEIFKISESDLLKQSCYSFKIKQFKGLEPYFFETKIYLSQPYLDSLFAKESRTLLVQYLIILAFTLLFSWTVFSKLIQKPLEKLRQFAYYETRAPKNFFIREIESIRHSLEMTFKRLHQEQKELYNLSTKDQLSGLYNKRSLIEKLEWLCVQKGDKEEKFALIMLDVDNFKTINDSLGHNIGDKVLQEVAEAILSSVSRHDIVSRIGGDEFAIILTQSALDVNIIERLKKIQKNIENPTILQSIKYYIHASMGVALFPKDGTDPHSLIKNADIAMYKSKESGKNGYSFFNDSFNSDIQKKIAAQNLLMEAYENGYFKLYYQPKVNILTKKVDSCEALIRLEHPTKGLISPNEFIPAAEENGFITTLGSWVIDESVKTLKAWSNSALREIKISINISAKQFLDPQLVTKLTQSTQDIERSKLDLELTESVFVDNYDKEHQTIHRLKSLGFTLSLDDFGTGYSSLSYLKNIPFDTIKIDKTFIDDIINPQGEAFVLMIINIAKTLELKVVAEGVESKEQEQILKKLGCDYYQGYLCSKPIEASLFKALIEQNNYL